MEGRRSSFDVTNTVDVTDPDSVCKEVCTLFESVYPSTSTRPIQRAFDVSTDLFTGNYPGYRPCDTPYHDLQHTMDVSLTMGRLLFGHESGRSHKARLGPELTRLGMIISLFHDSGYVRRIADRCHANGAEYTDRHVTRSGRFLAAFLPQVGLDDMVSTARKLVHFTGYEIAVPAIPLRDPEQRTLGKLLGTADLLAQMSDRCYLEKCRDRLYPEFVAAGLAGRGRHYHSPEDLIYKTPLFFKHIMDDRLENVLNGVHSFARSFFLPQKDLYRDALESNREYLHRVVEMRDLSMLRRQPPWTLVIESNLLLPPT